VKLTVTGCNHHASDVTVRERLAFTPAQTVRALGQLRQRFPESEGVLLSTCNRVELYVASPDEQSPSADELGRFLAEFHSLDAEQLMPHLFHVADRQAVLHLFSVAASLDSMVLGEAQILSQVKQAFAAARQHQCAGPLTSHLFDSANRAAKRVASETSIHHRRVSIPSIAVADYAKRLFETFHDKHVLVIGAGEMAEETLHYLRAEGASDIVIVNRTAEHARKLAEAFSGRVEPWGQLHRYLAWADLVISTTGARQPVVTAEAFRAIESQRSERLLFVLDLAVPRDFEAAVDQFANVYLYCIDDLRAACEANRRARQKQWPKAQQIIQQEADRFLQECQHRITVPTIRRLKQQADEIKAHELRRLINKLGALEPRQQAEIAQSFDRLTNKLLHPPLESLRDEAQHGSPHSLLSALRRLFQIDD
jgi:glutamyl-tRNA reductase